MSAQLEKYQRLLAGKKPEEIIDWALDKWGVREIVLASSLGAEDQVLTFLFAQRDRNARVFTLDTGRLFQETFDLMDQTMGRYGFRYEVIFPDQQKVEEMVGHHGPNLFYHSREYRVHCCTVRKTQPLQRVLKTASAWICGLRREQAPTRTDIEAIEWDEVNSLYKINPLYNWTEAQVWDYIKERNIPFNELHSKGFRSIGCQPCTRAVQKGEDVRAGRWWWEDVSQRECGLHKRK
ncbi:Phosphoadenylyl-sulfate reductase [thioredoxin] [Chitinispirillum alkaliphilum]|nr:Phosphoadenylyl-sulfate reductase [thioredoxin] [Chitinispirillum alkaliphilum]